MKKNTRKLVFAGMFLALAFILPSITGQIREIGNALCPMHIPVILCGFFCGPWYALAVGVIAPILRSIIFGMPPLFPRAIAMAIELATYGVVSSLMYKILPKKKLFVYISLIIAMISGRVVWGIASTFLYKLAGADFGFKAFLSGALLNAVPGIIFQIVLIPILVMILEKFTYEK